MIYKIWVCYNNTVSKFKDISIGDRFEIRGDDFHITKDYKKISNDTAMLLGGSSDNNGELVYHKFNPEDEIHVPRIYTSGHWKRWKS